MRIIYLIIPTKKKKKKIVFRLVPQSSANQPEAHI